MNKRALTLAELEEIINDPNFMDDVESADIVVLPPETDYLTDEDEADDDVLGVVDVADVPGELELQYTTITSQPEEVDQEENDDLGSEMACAAKNRTSRKKDVSLTYLQRGVRYHHPIQNLPLKVKKFLQGSRI